MKPRTGSRCRAILLQKVDPIGFFNSRQNIGIRICACKNVLVYLESCVGMFCWIILSPKRLQGKFLRHYIYSDWFNWIYSPASDSLKYPSLVKSRQSSLVKSVPVLPVVHPVLHHAWWTNIMYYLVLRAPVGLWWCNNNMTSAKTALVKNSLLVVTYIYDKKCLQFFISTDMSH